MSITSPDSDSFALISTSNANGSINNVSQLSKTLVNCCPKCNSRSIRYRIKTEEYFCNHCKSVFRTPGALKLRSRKSCPRCGSIGIDRKTFSKGYRCSQCLSNFSIPVIKLVPDSINYGRPLINRARNTASKTEAV